MIFRGSTFPAQNKITWIWSMCLVVIQPILILNDMIFTLSTVNEGLQIIYEYSVHVAREAKAWRMIF